MDRVDSSDVEHGVDAAVQAPSPVHGRIISRIIRIFQASKKPGVEYPRGYPRFSAFASEPEYQNFRRFKVLRTRMLLRKQDEIAQLESSLNEVDRNETSKLWLGYQRKYKNAERKAIFDKLEEAFDTYDSFLHRTHWAMKFQEPHLQHMEDMRMWMEYHKCIEESEAAYLDADISDLMNVGDAADHSLGKRMPFSEKVAMTIHRWLRKAMTTLLRQNSKTTELWIRPSINKAVVRVFAGSLAVILLLLPVIILNVVQSIVAKFGVMFIAATAFISTLTAVSLAGMAEIFVAGATYTAVLVVFVSQDGFDETR